MPKRGFRPDDAYRLRAASDPDMSPDGRRVAFSVVDTDQEQDRLRWSIWVVPVDGSAPPRRFSEGPADKRPRWSSDGRWLAYISVGADEGDHAELRLAPLDGGVPSRLGELPGPVEDFAWSPDATRIVVVCRVGAPDPTTAQERNAPRIPRGLAARLDGVGWQDGRRHLFIIEVETGAARQLTRGEYDHEDPSFSPDGGLVTFVSDRHPRRDDRQFRSDVWTVAASGGRPRRLTDGKGSASFPTFSPDGETIAFVGEDDDRWDSDTYVFLVPVDGGAPAERLAPELDRPTVLWPGQPAPFAWVSDRDLLVLIADHGAVRLHRGRVGQRSTREVIGGDLLIDGLAACPGRRIIAFSGSWPDQPSELFAAGAAGGDRVQLTNLNAEFLEEVELAPVGRSTVVRPDGTEVEYFTILPSGGAASARRVPLHIDIHGGPHASWPSGRWLALHQSIAAAGYAVVLPNPRGSTSYGQAFTRACTGDWGGGDAEDILACCDDLVERGIADGTRMFVSGGSYGGFMTSWLVGHTERFSAATAVAAVVDQTSMALTTEIPEFALFHMGGKPWDRRAEYELRSPLTYLPNVRTPVQVIHWEGDIRVPISQGEELYSGLRVLGRKTEIVRYPGGFHIMRTPSQAVDMTRRILAWNGQHDKRPKRRALRLDSASE